jgi:hypothetical protein
MGWFGVGVGPHHRKTSPCVSSEAAPLGYFRSLLEGAKKADLNDIEVSPSGLGIHFPSLGADIHIPSLLQGHLGSQKWLELRKEKGSA